MVWKPKAKALSREEAVAKAKKDLTPLWFGSEPLFVGVAAGTKSTLFPLVEGFSDKAWLIFLLDPLDFAGQAALWHARELHRRYRSLELGVIIIVRPYHRFMMEPDFMAALIRRFQLTLILTLDQGGLLTTALGGKVLPKALLMHQGRFILEQAGADWHRGAEQKIQTFLRSHDPGLPLLPLYEVRDENTASDCGRMDFARWEKYPKPGFQPLPGGLSTAHFGNTDRPGAPPPGELFIRGAWVRDQDRIITSDRTAEIRFCANGPDFSLIASIVSKTAEVAEVSVEVGDDAANDEIAGEDILKVDSGGSVLKVVEARLYSALVKMPLGQRAITLRFPSADRVPVALYGLRFGGAG